MPRTRSDITPADIVQALLSDTRFGLKRNGDFLRDGLCPQCNRKTLYIGTEHPWILRCNRSNNCGYEEPVRNVLESLFADFAGRYKPTEEKPNATADAYLALDRGFDLSKIRGWYEQAMHQIPGTTKGIPSVRFYLDAERTRYWERLIGRTGKDSGPKAIFGGKRKADGKLYSGDAWTPPGFTLEEGDTCFITEGIFHLIALHHTDRKAAAALSANHYPADFIAQHKGKKIRWIVALDSGRAGEEGARKFHKLLTGACEQCEVLLLPPHKDWDDLHREGKITDAFIEERLYYGRLFVAESVQEKAFHYYIHPKHRKEKFTLEFRNALYSIEVLPAFHDALADVYTANAGDGEELPKETKSLLALCNHMLNTPEAQEAFVRSLNVTQISNIYPTFEYMERDEVLDEQRYVFNIRYANGQTPDRIAMDGSAFASPDAFHKAMLTKTRGGTFDGSSGQLKFLRDKWLNGRILTVKALNFIGYDKECESYIFQDHAFHKGRYIPVNSNGYFNINKEGVKTVLNGVSINTGGKFSADWLPDFARAFHWQGMAALAFWLGSLFVQQIRAKHKTYPFFELTGEPGAGKSTILEFLWKCAGRDEYEGFDLLKATSAGRRRAFSQVSNLPVVIIESDRDNGDKDAKQKQFGFDEVKPFYNGRGTGTLGVARRNNDVDEHLFQASLLISQNAEVDGSEALLQRIVHCHADKKHHAPGTREIARKFERHTSETVGGFLIAALSKEKEILEAYETAFPVLEAQFSKDMKIERIAKNHAQIAALGHALHIVFGEYMTDHLRDGLTEYLRIRGKERENRLGADHPLIEQFWEQFEYVNALCEGGLNYAAEPTRIAVNFNHFRDLAQKHGQPLLDMQLLKKLLPGCKRHKLLAANKPTWHQRLDKSFRCWVFENRHPANNSES